MTITLYTCIAENNRIDKTNYLSNAFIVEGTLRDNVSVINPVITVEKSNPTYYNYNYMFISAFNRWYYITNIIHRNNKLWEISGHVDVLYTWRASIISTRCIIDKTSNYNDANLYLDDGSFVMDSHKYNTVIQYPNGLQESGQYILICQGG